MQQNISQPTIILGKIKELVASIKRKIKTHQQIKLKKSKLLITQPKTLMGGTLKQYQLQALAWMIELAKNNMNGILADDMGLGKTIQTLSFIAYLQQQFGIKGKHLIVSPKNVLRNWQKQAKKWTKDLQIIVLPATQVERQYILQKYVKKGKFDILITTYLGSQVSENILRKKFFWQTLIIDEAHSIKNQDTILAHTLRRYRAKFTLLLTGTPLSNRLQQLWSLLNFIMPDLFFDNNMFKQIEQSVNQYQGNQEQKLKYQCQIALYFKKMIQPFMKRRTKNQINLGLKQKKQMTLYVSLTQLQLKMYRNYLKYHSVYGDKIGYQINSQIQCRKICSHPYIFPQIQNPQQILFGQHLINNCGKLKLLDKLLNKLIKQKHKVLIFSQFVTLLVILQDYCIYRNYQYAKIDGQSSLDKRQYQVNKFDTDQNIVIFLISTRAGGLGLNLIAADVVIIYDIDWNPQIDKQAMDRAYRIGQTKSVQVFKLISANTVQERMIQVQKYKLIWDQLVIQKGGLATFNQSQAAFSKINYQKIMNLGAQQIFKIQQNSDDKTIQQIIKIGQQKDQNKTKQIRQKLQKDFQKYGPKINPYQQLEDQVNKIDSINYESVLIKHKEQQQREQRKKNKLQKLNNQYVILQKHKFYQHKLRVQSLLIMLKNESNQQKIQQYEQQLRKQGFYDWTKLQYKQFLQANQKYLKTDYQKIKQYIPTKNIKEIKQYSEVFYRQGQKALVNGKAIMKKIEKKQKAIESQKKIQELTKTIKQFSDMQGLYIDWKMRVSKQKAQYQINKQVLTRLQFNNLIEYGVCFQQFKPIIQNLIPHQLTLYQWRIKNKTNKQKFLQKVVNFWQNKQNKLENQKKMKQKFNKLRKKYFTSEKSKLQKIEIFQQKESSDGTQIIKKPESQTISNKSITKTPIKIVSRTKPKK